MPRRVVKLAELYAADNSGTVHALDANTGVRFWTHSFGATVTALAVNDSKRVYRRQRRAASGFAAGARRLYAMDAAGRRQHHAGSLVTNSHSLLVLQSGGIFLINAVNGGILDAAQSVLAGNTRRPGGERATGVDPSRQRHALRLSARRDQPTRRPGWDSLLVALLTLALLQITGLAEQAALPGNRVQDVLRHPLLGSLLPPSGDCRYGRCSPTPATPSACCWWR